MTELTKPTTEQFFDASLPFNYGGKGRKTSLANHLPLQTEGKKPGDRYTRAYSLVENRLLKAEASHILDLGCGIGGALLYFSEMIGGQLSGITLSTAEQNTAKSLIDRRNLQSRMRVFRADFDDPRTFRVIGNPDAVYSIDALNYSTDIPSLCTHAAEHLAPGGAFIVLEPVLSPDCPVELADTFRDLSLRHSLTTADAMSVAIEGAGLSVITRVEAELDTRLEISPVRLSRLMKMDPSLRNRIAETGKLLNSLVKDGYLAMELIEARKSAAT